MMTIPNRRTRAFRRATDDSDNKEVRKFLEPTKFDFKPKAHWDIGHDLGILDPEIGRRSRGAVLCSIKGWARALSAWL